MIARKLMSEGIIKPSRPIYQHHSYEPLGEHARLAQTNRTYRRSVLLALAAAIILLISGSIYTRFFRPSSNAAGVSLLPFLSRHQYYHRNNDYGGRPKIYTYYRLVDLREAMNRNKMLHSWAASWEKAGWNPTVLTIDNARQHPDFADHLANGLRISHNVRYTRYLAMATIAEGAWFSEYYVMPLTTNVTDVLPNNGKFTGHDRHVSSLLSGSQSEWDRMARLLITHPLDNDMLSLHEIHKADPDSYQEETNVVHAKTLLLKAGKGEVRPAEVCEVTAGKIAMRFSPEDLDVEGYAGRSAESIVKEWMTVWSSHCRQ